MRSLSLLAVLLSVCISAFSQSSPLRGQAIYLEVINLHGVSFQEGDLDDNFFSLDFTQTTSVYRYSGEGEPTKYVGADSGAEEHLDRLERRNIYYTDIGAQELLAKEYEIGGPYLVREPLPKIDWELQEGQKEIGGLVCQKATASFRGRYYTAWFTPEIPVRLGPWKLGGLPGLIVEAYDESQTVKFLFHSLSYPTSTDTELLPPDQGKEIGLLELDQAIEVKSREMIKRITAKMGDHVSITMTTDKVQRIEQSFEDVKP